VSGAPSLPPVFGDFRQSLTAGLCDAFRELNALQHMIEVLTHLSRRDATPECLVKGSVMKYAFSRLLPLVAVTVFSLVTLPASASVYDQRRMK
jgi:hypothetical protein